MRNDAKKRQPALYPELRRFTRMLVMEAKIVSGLMFQELDDALGVSQGSTARWSSGPQTCTGRGVCASNIQNLENRVARLLGRASHTVIILNTDFRTPSNELSKYAFAYPAAGLNFVGVNGSALKLAYADGWPTFDERSTAKNLDWQYRTLWERGVLDPRPYRQSLACSEDAPIDFIIERLTSDWHHQYERALRNRSWRSFCRAAIEYYRAINGLSSRRQPR